MNIDKTTYITVTNRVKVTAAISFVKDILTGFDGVTTDEERTEIMKILYKWEDALFEKINVGSDT